jgi:putative transposase
VAVQWKSSLTLLISTYLTEVESDPTYSGRWRGAPVGSNLQRMPRLPRFFVPGLPLHVIQRGNDRTPIFGGPDDRAFFQRCLDYAARDHAAAIHAYVLMSNHVHLLVSPSCASSVPKMMQSIGRIYVQYFNRVHQRTGTLWEGRYKAAIIEKERYLLTCMRYIELNPVRARMVLSPGEFRWSSFRANAIGARDNLVTPHAVYQDLGRSPERRQAAYRDLFSDAISPAELASIRDATQHAWALGGDVFRGKIATLSRRAQRIPLGRPSPRESE